MPKLYFIDTGLLAHLLEINDTDSYFSSIKQGPLFENMIVVDRLKRRSHEGLKAELYYFRDSNGLEIDIIERFNKRTSLIEVKGGKTFKPGFTDQMYKLYNIDNSLKLKVIYGGDDSFKMKDVEVASWKDID